MGVDTEFNFRLRKRGYKFLFDSSLYVYHHHPTNLGRLVKKWYKYGENYIKPYLKHKEMRTTGFYARVLYIPVFLILIVFSFLNIIFLYAASFQILVLFLAYLYIGLRVCRRSILI